MKVKKYIETQRGVTLVALGITIVVLMILAGISIANLTSNDGTIDHAFDAKIQSNLSSIYESTQMEINNKEAERIKDRNYEGSTTEDDISEFVTKIETNDGLSLGVYNDLDSLNVKTDLGKGSKNINEDWSGNMADLQDCYVINFVTGNVYYINEGKIWEISGNTDVAKIKESENEYVEREEKNNKVYYKVTYNARYNGGKLANSSEEQVKLEDQKDVNLSVKAQRENYTFIGWNTDKNAHKNLETLKVNKKNITLYAIFKKDIKVTFNSRESEPEVNNFELYNNDKSVKVQAPKINDIEKDGKTFVGLGWAKDNNANSEIVAKAGEEIEVTDTAQYYAVYGVKNTSNVPSTPDTETKQDGVIPVIFNYYDGNKTSRSIVNVKCTLGFDGEITYGTDELKVPDEVINSNGPEGTKFQYISTTDVGEPVETPDINIATKYYAIYSKDVKLTKIIYQNQEVNDEENIKKVYGYYNGSIKKAEFNLGTDTEKVINKGEKEYRATPRGWSTNSAPKAEIEVKLNESVSIVNDTTYYMSYEYSSKVSYPKTNGETGTVEQHTYVGSDGKEETETQEIPKGDVTIPKSDQDAGWKNKKDEQGNDVWTTTPEDPNNNENWVDPKNPGNTDVTIYPVLEKEIKVTRYVHKNTPDAITARQGATLPLLTGTIYKTMGGSGEITPATINLGTAPEIKITKGTNLYQAVPRHWSNTQDPKSPEPGPTTVNSSVDLNGTVSLIDDATYYMSYKYTQYIKYTDNKGQEQVADQDVYLGYDGTEVSDPLNLPEGNTSPPSELGPGWKEKEDEEDKKVWTTNPEDPGNENNWVKPDDPDSKTDPDVKIYPVYEKQITVTRYVHKDAENATPDLINGGATLPALTATVYVSSNKDKVSYAPINLGSTNKITIVKDESHTYEASPRFWSKNKSPKAEETDSVALDGTIYLNEDTTYYMSYIYTKYIKNESGTVEQDIYVGTDGTEEDGEVRIQEEDENVPPEIEEDGYDRKKDEEGKGVWTTDPNNPDEEDKWVDPNDPEFDPNTPIYPVYTKEITLKQYIYNTNLSKTDTRTIYRSSADTSIKPITFNLGSADSVQVTKYQNQYIAQPRHWSTSDAPDSPEPSGEESINEKSVNLGADVHLTEDATYYMSYTYDKIIQYSDGGTDLKSTAQKVYMNYKGDESYTPYNGPEGGVKPPEGEDDFKPKQDEKNDNVWTTDPNNPGDESKWVDPKDPSKEIDPKVPIYPVFEKTISVTRYVHENTELSTPDYNIGGATLPTLTGTVYISNNKEKVTPATINLGSVNEVAIIKDATHNYKAEPKFWSTSKEPNAQEETGSVNESKVDLNGDAHLTENSVYYMSYAYTFKIAYVDPIEGEGEVDENINVGFDGKEVADPWEFPKTPNVHPGWTTPEKWTFKHWTIDDNPSSDAVNNNEGIYDPSVKLHATFEKDVTITYNENEGNADSIPESQTGKSYRNDKNEIPAKITISQTIPTKDRHKFLGWNEEQGSSQGKYDAGEEYSFDTDTTLYAIWTLIDNEPPTIKFVEDGSEEWSKTHTTKIVVEDNEKVDNTSLRYMWSQDNTEPGEDDFAGSNGIAFDSNVEISKGEVTGTDWHIWALAKDTKGNVTIKKSKDFWFDNTPPSTDAPDCKPTIASITASCNQEDYESGISFIRYKLFTPTGGQITFSGSDTYLFTNILISPNNTYGITTIVEDKCGNQVESERVDVKTLDIPTPTITAKYPGQWTNQSEYATIDYHEYDDIPATKQYVLGKTVDDYNNRQIAEEDWQTYENPVEIPTNQTIIARVIMENNVRATAMTFNNIDKDIPIVTNISRTANQINWDAKDVGSGVGKYLLSPVYSPNKLPGTPNWFQENMWYQNVYQWSDMPSATGTIYIYVQDRAGNIGIGQIDIPGLYENGFFVEHTSSTQHVFTYINRNMKAHIDHEINVDFEGSLVEVLTWDEGKPTTFKVNENGILGLMQTVNDVRSDPSKYWCNSKDLKFKIFCKTCNSEIDNHVFSSIP